MKPNIHPAYHQNVQVRCVCGNTFVTGATVESISVEICSNCHPFFTGKSKIVDTAGRVDKFKARVEAAKRHKAARPMPKAKVVQVEEQSVAAEVVTLDPTQASEVVAEAVVPEEITSEYMENAAYEK